MYWKSDLFYIPHVQSDICSISGQSPRPDTIQNVVLTNPAMRQSHTTVSISIAWDVPDMNGKFEKYQLCLSDAQLNGSSDPNTLLCKDVYKV